MFPHAEQCSLKWKAELDAEEAVQPKRLKSVVEMLRPNSGMQAELTIREVLLEHLETF